MTALSREYNLKGLGIRWGILIAGWQFHFSDEPSQIVIEFFMDRSLNHRPLYLAILIKAHNVEWWPNRGRTFLRCVGQRERGQFLEF